MLNYKKVFLYFAICLLFACCKKNQITPRVKKPNQTYNNYNGDFTFEFMDRVLSGQIYGNPWGDSCGTAKESYYDRLYRVQLYGLNFQDPCNFTEEDEDHAYENSSTFGTISFYIESDTGTFTYPRDEFHSKYSENYTSFYFNHLVFSSGSNANVQITSFDTTTNIVTGRISACSSCYSETATPMYVNGNFTAIICE